MRSYPARERIGWSTLRREISPHIQLSQPHPACASAPRYWYVDCSRLDHRSTQNEEAAPAPSVVRQSGPETVRTGGVPCRVNDPRARLYGTACLTPRSTRPRADGPCNEKVSERGPVTGNVRLHVERRATRRLWLLGWVYVAAIIYARNLRPGQTGEDIGGAWSGF
jgi:hypothetical protein